MYKINKISPDTSAFLQMMQGIAYMPKSLYLLGKLPDTHLPAVSIIGTRRPSAYGQEIGYKLAYELARQGVVVVSGLAFGIDSIAHKGALDAGGVTIAIMPGGLDHIYPNSHRALAERIIKNGGALISEYPVGVGAYKSSFVERNRIVAAIADGLVVVEAAIKSGTYHTASFALDYGRPVMAVPGTITNAMAAGTNNLIKTGARLISETADILDEIGVDVPKTQTQLPLTDTPEQGIVVKLLASGVRDGEELQVQSGLVPAVFSQTLTMLEITGIVRALGGNQWGIK
jgi:DNA processing protein